MVKVNVCEEIESMICRSRGVIPPHPFAHLPVPKVDCQLYMLVSSVPRETILYKICLIESMLQYSSQNNNPPLELLPLVVFPHQVMHCGYRWEILTIDDYLYFVPDKSLAPIFKIRVSDLDKIIPSEENIVDVDGKYMGEQLCHTLSWKLGYKRGMMSFVFDKKIYVFTRFPSMCSRPFEAYDTVLDTSEVLPRPPEHHDPDIVSYVKQDHMVYFATLYGTIFSFNLLTKEWDTLIYEEEELKCKTRRRKAHFSSKAQIIGDKLFGCLYIQPLYSAVVVASPLFFDKNFLRPTIAPSLKFLQALNSDFHHDTDICWKSENIFTLDDGNTLCLISMHNGLSQETGTCSRDLFTKYTTISFFKVPPGFNTTKIDPNAFDVRQTMPCFRREPPPNCFADFSDDGPLGPVPNYILYIKSAFSSYGVVNGVHSADESGTRVVVSFLENSSAKAALEAMDRHPCQELGGRVLHIKYSVFQPPVQQVNNSIPVCLATSDLNIPGIHLIHDFVTIEEEKELLAAVDNRPWNSLAKRRVQHYGYEFRYETRNVDANHYLGELLSFLSPVLNKISSPKELSNTSGMSLDQLTVNEYPPGVGLSPHIDTHSAFEGSIYSLSLAGPCIMEFGKYTDGDWLSKNTSLADREMENTNSDCTFLKRAIYLPPRSILLFSGDARYAWHHYIPHHKVDMVNDSVIRRASRRVSFTIRKVRKGSCQCAYPQYCDSQK